MTAPTSLRRQLFLWLALPLSGVVLLAALVFYPIALLSARTGYDQALMDTAHSLARLTPVLVRPGAIVSAEADIVLRSDQYDRIYYSVHGPDGKLIAGDRQLKIPPLQSFSAGGFFYDAQIDDEPVRIAALRVPHDGDYLVVQAAETTVKRRTLADQVLTGLVAVELLLISAVGILVWFGIDKGLAPLQRLQREIEMRSHRDLRPVPEEQVPIEARPLVLSLNNLLQRLAAAIHSQEAFVANAAHQLRTPLAGLRMQVEYALQQENPAEWKRALTTIGPLTARTVHLVNQLLTLAKAEGNVHAVAEEMDLAQQVEDLAAEWMPSAIVKDIDLGLEVAPAVVRGNPFLVRELISNLLDNAIRHSPCGGRVTVRTFTAEDNVVLQIEDEGTGIPATERKNVFRRFYRVNDAPGDGSGLGLSIVEEISKSHGANVEILEPPGGRGALFCVTFRSNYPPGNGRRENAVTEERTG